ncbi:pectinesterase-like protein [Cinnamomum micranthum f. kanehirae]|uniref:Pectinesterase n=1 Tax=Cinnamomum micranthum f. kanehirae TaxID=337451 RepID=A0A443PJ87_9MAGN|nr:pectinesterase-like protein [Cinnamomum micranthum f. kanehirae]
MNEVDEINFLVSNFIYGDNLLPATGIPFERAIVNSIVIRESVVVDQHGLGNFTTIREALVVASNETDIKDGFFQIHVKGGICGEYVSVVYNKTIITITGDEKNIRIITENHCVDLKGEHFIAINMTFRNIARVAMVQALAVQNNVNLSAFYNCSFECFQDALCASSGSQFYRSCDIYGTIDFIFGYAAAVFQTCNIYVRLPLQGQSNVITAHGRGAANEGTGYSIQHCKTSASPELACGGPGSKLDRRVRWLGYHAHINEVDEINFIVSNFISDNNWLPATGIPFERAIENNIVIRESVVVDQHGLENFTTIREALAATPNETNVKDGFFQIQVKGGICEEYISIVYNKKNIMITGNEKNITIITGNCSVGDGWETG